MRPVDELERIRDDEERDREQRALWAGIRLGVSAGVVGCLLLGLLAMRILVRLLR